MPLFMLSYARLDARDDPYLRRFFDELKTEVRRRAGIEPGDICFIDQENIEPGEEWSPELAEAIGTCNALVCIYTPTYFTREYCGKEWQFFRSRLDQYVRNLPAQNKLPPLILPVLWLPLQTKLPDAVCAVQYTHSDFGDRYADVGLLELMRTRKYRDEYTNFVSRFAEKIIAATSADPFPPFEGPFSLKDIQPAFPTENLSENPPAENRNVSVKVLPQWIVHFVFVAGTRIELEHIKRQVEYYGNSEIDWRPYLPNDPKSVRLFAQIVATEKELISEKLDLDDDLINNIQEAQQNNELVILLADAWAFDQHLARYHTRLRPYDNFISMNSALLILWNDEDLETTQNQTQLKASIRTTFATKTTYKNPVLFRDQVNTPDQLKAQLRDTLEKLMMNITNTGEAKRKPPISDIGGLPGISNLN